MATLILLSVFAVVGFLVWFGYRWAVNDLRIEQMQVDRERQALDVEWEALQRTRQLRAAFLNARRAMQAEAQPTPNQQRRQWPHGR
jgi:hypothetical protein